MRITVLGTTLRENEFMAPLYEFKKRAVLRGHTCSLLKYGEFSLVLKKDRNLLMKGWGYEELLSSDIVIPRLGIKKMCRGDFYILDWLKIMGLNYLNSIDAIEVARNKITSLQMLHTAGINVVPTMVTRQLDHLEQTEILLGPPPYIVKPSMGSKGADIEMAKNSGELIEIVKRRWSVDRNEILLIQPLLKTVDSKIWDIRVFVLLGEVIGAMKRIAPEGDFRANYSLGGSIETLKIDSQTEKCALLATRALSLDMAGVDIIITEEGPVVLEVNANPGWEGISSAAMAVGEDFFDRFITVLEAYFG